MVEDFSGVQHHFGSAASSERFMRESTRHQQAAI